MRERAEETVGSRLHAQRVEARERLSELLLGLRAPRGEGERLGHRRRQRHGTAAGARARTPAHGSRRRAAGGRQPPAASSLSRRSETRLRPRSVSPEIAGPAARSRRRGGRFRGRAPTARRGGRRRGLHLPVDLLHRRHRCGRGRGLSEAAQVLGQDFPIFGGTDGHDDRLELTEVRVHRLERDELELAHHVDLLEGVEEVVRDRQAGSRAAPVLRRRPGPDGRQHRLGRVFQEQLDRVRHDQRRQAVGKVLLELEDRLLELRRLFGGCPDMDFFTLG